MHANSDIMAYTVPPEQRGYYELSSAIVRMAVEDYRTYRKAWHRNKEGRRAQWLIDEMRTFFLSDVFEKISGLENPNAFLMRLDEQIDKEYAAGAKRKRYKSTIQFK